MRRVILLLSSAVMLVIAASAAQAVTLRYRGKAGEVRKYSYADATRMQSEGGGVETRMESTSTALLAQKIKSVDDGVLTIEQKLTKGKTTAKVEGMDEPMKEDLPEVTILIKMDAQGRIKQFKSEEGFMTMAPTQELGRVLAEMGMFPKRDLKVGDTWSDEKEITEGDIGTIKIHYTRKLSALEPYRKRNCAKIETKFNGAIEPPEDIMNGDDMPGAEFEATIRFSGTAVTWFDHEAGVVVEEDNTMKMLMEMRFTMPAIGAGEDVEHSSKMATIVNTKMALQK